MPATVNPLKKAIVTRELLKGKSARQALKTAKYSKSAIRQSTHNAVVKQSMKNIMASFDKSVITTDYVLSELEKAKKLCIKGKKKDMSSFIRACELLGKYLQMWSDSNINILVNNADSQFSLANRVKKLKEAKQP